MNPTPGITKGKGLQSRARLLRLSDLDQRTGAAKEIQRIAGAIKADLGHDTTTAEDQLIESAAVCVAMVRDLAARWLQGEECDPAVFSGLLQTQARLFSLIGLKRRPREVGTPSLSEYLAQKAVPES